MTKKTNTTEAGLVVRQLRENQRVSEWFGDEKAAEEARRAADLIEKLTIQIYTTP